MNLGPTSSAGKVALAAGAVAALLGVMFVILLFGGGGATISSVVAAQCSSGAGPGGEGGSGPPPGQGFGSNEPSPEALSDIPGNYLEAYRAAGKEYGIDWTYIAGIGKVETDHGRYDNGSGSGCIEGPSTPYGTAKGPMQFIDSTWASVGVDGNGDGVKDPCNYEDAIPSAANYMKQSGAPGDMYGAIYAYNHADWYVNDVMGWADKYRAAEREQGGDEQAAGQALDATTANLALTAMAQSPVALLPTGTVSGAAEWAFSPFTGLGSALGARPANAEPQGWDTVNGDQQLTYEDYSAYDTAVSKAVSDWNALGSVPVNEVGSGADIDVGDTVLEAGVGGRTSTEGWIYFNTNAMDGATQNAQNAIASHEFGHALGLGHETGATVMQGVTTNSSSNYESPTDRDKEVYYSIWGDAPPEGTPVNNPSGGGDGDGGGGGKAVFPLPEEYQGDFSNDWGAARPGGQGHEGTDIFAPDGTAIHSITKGKVVPVAGSNESGWNELGGWTVMIEASEDIGPIKKGDRLYYAHMVEPPSVKPGDTVEAGDQIGKVGSTGEGPQGSILPDGRGKHLHLGWYDSTGSRAESPSGAMNPYPLLQWLIENGGTATGGDPGEPVACEQPSSGPDSGPNGSGPSSPPGEGPNGGGGQQGGSGNEVVEEARKYTGTPYYLGGLNSYDCAPNVRMDCTCLTYTVFKKWGFNLPDFPLSLLDYGEPVEEADLQPGDILIYDETVAGTGGHAGIYSGNGQQVHASSFLGEVGESSYRWDGDGYIGARRLVTGDGT